MIRKIIFTNYIFLNFYTKSPENSGSNLIFASLPNRVLLLKSLPIFGSAMSSMNCKQEATKKVPL